MNHGIIKLNEDAAGTQTGPQVNYRTLEEFQAALNAEPAPHEIEINKAAGNSRFIPIGIIQNKLDQFFMGLWAVEDFRTQVVVNEIVGSVKLKFYHPFAKTWIEREGAASVMIMQKSGADIQDIGAEIKNTLQKDYPHLLASCVASAAKTIGKAFGRDLNRKQDIEYTKLYSEFADAAEGLKEIDFEAIKTVDELVKAWNSKPHLHANSEFCKRFAYRKRQLSK